MRVPQYFNQYWKQRKTESMKTGNFCFSESGSRSASRGSIAGREILTWCGGIKPPLASADSIDGGTVSAHYITVQPLPPEHVHKRCPVGAFELLQAWRLLDTPSLGIVQKVDHLNSFNGF